MTNVGEPVAVLELMETGSYMADIAPPKCECGRAMAETPNECDGVRLWTCDACNTDSSYAAVAHIRPERPLPPPFDVQAVQVWTGTEAYGPIENFRLFGDGWRPINAHQDGTCKHGNRCHTCGKKLSRASLACHGGWWHEALCYSCISA